MWIGYKFNRVDPAYINVYTNFDAKYIRQETN